MASAYTIAILVGRLGPKPTTSTTHRGVLKPTSMK
jgi:hypothetical protein